MLAHPTRVLDNAGVTPEDTEALASLLVAPPPYTFDPGELVAANEAQMALLAALVAAARPLRCGTALHRLLGWVETAQPLLSAYDQGRFWHLKGVAAWRLDDAFYSASRALHRGIALLQGLDTLAAQAYLGRIFDTFGQLLQHQGLLHDARREFERALDCKRAGHDQQGVALTLGNLGRLCLELGNFTAAARYFRRDLRLLTASQQPDMACLRLQLLSHLGTCALELSKRRAGPPREQRLREARHAFEQSARLAWAHAVHDGMAFVALGLGKVALLEADLAAAHRQARAARRYVQQASIPPLYKEGINGLIRQLTAEIHLASGRVRQALQDFRAAHASFLQAPNVSPVEMAQLPYGLARAHLANGQERQATGLLRQALLRLDATEAEQLRAQIETEMRQHFHESWLLHTAGRFLGPQHIAFLLEHAGRGGFRGDTQDVIILFSDIRKGKDMPVVVANVMGEDDGSSFVQPLKAEIAHVRKALAHFQPREFPQASAAFATLAMTAEQTGNLSHAHGYRFLAHTAAAYASQPLPATWAGEITMEEK